MREQKSIFKVENNLIKMLHVFKLARANLVNDILQENADIFKAMFKYEDDSSLMSLSIEQYLIKFINSHFLLSDEEGFKNEKFYFSVVKLIKSLDIKLSTKTSSQLFQKILDDKLIFIQKLLSVDDDESFKYDKLVYSYQKDKTLFDREFRKQQENKNEFY